MDWTSGRVGQSERDRMISRRDFLGRAAIMVAAVPLAGSLLAACGDSDDDSADEVSAAAPTATTSATATAVSTDEDDDADDEPADPTATDLPEESVEDGDGPRYGGIFNIMVGSEITSLSPDDSGVIDRRMAVGNMHNSLVFQDAYYTFLPDLAESWEIADDGLQYRFNLHEGVTFHDGEPCTSSDVKYTFEYYGNPENATIQAGRYREVASVETPDESTVIVNMSSPNAAFLVGAGTSYIVPEHYHSEIGEEAYKASPLGTGPFKLKEWRAATVTELEVNEDYFKGRPFLDGIRIEVVPEASVATVKLTNGEGDAYIRILVPEDNLRFRDNPEFAAYTVRVTTSLLLLHFPMDLRLPKFQDKAVRQAMMYALDRDGMIADLLFGLATKATAHSSQAIEFYYEPDVTVYDYDPDKAIQLLEDAGWHVGSNGIREKDGEVLSWTCTLGPGNEVNNQIALVAQQAFQAIGLDMQLAEAPFTTVLDGLVEGGTEMSIFGNTYGGTDPNPAETMRSDARANWSNWTHPRVDELIEAGLTETNPDQRRPYYSELQQLVAEEVPFLYLWFPERFDIFTPRIQGVPEEPLGSTAMYLDAHQLWIRENDAQ